MTSKLMITTHDLVSYTEEIDCDVEEVSFKATTKHLPQRIFIDIKFDDTAYQNFIALEAARENKSTVAIRDAYGTRLMGSICNVVLMGTGSVSLWFDADPINKMYIEHFLKYAE